MKVRILRVILIVIFSSMVYNSIALCVDTDPPNIELMREEQERASRDSIVTPPPTPQTQGAEHPDVQKQLMTLGIRPKGEDYKSIAIEAQKELKKLGYYTAAIDGIIGRISIQALRDFQRDLDLPITGQLDQETLDRLSKPTLILNTQDFPPFHYKIDIFENKVYGPVAETIRAVCIEAEINCILRLYDWGEAQELVKTDKAHGMFVIGWNAARAKFLHRSVPIIETEYGFFVRQEDSLNFTHLEDIDGYTVGVYGPSNTSRTLRQIENALRSRNMQIHVKETRDDKPLFKELSESQGISAVFSNKDVGNSIINGLGVGNIRYAGPYKKLLYYVGFSKNLVDDSIVNRFDVAFQNLQKAGIVQEIYANSGLLGKPEKSDVQVSKIEEKQKENDTIIAQRFVIREANDQEMILDNTTCLIWQKSGAEKEMTWNEAQNYVRTLNEDKYAGYSDWRLPKIHELTSLLESDIRKRNRLYIDPLFDSMQQTCWSADSVTDQNNNIMEIQFIDYYEGSSASKDPLDTNFVRAVRGNSCQ